MLELDMPQKLSRVKRISGLLWGGGSLAKQPALSAMIAEVIATWSDTERQIGSVLAKLLETEPATILEVYLNLEGKTAKSVVMETASRNKLDDEEFKLLLKIQKAIKPVRERRNEFAHGIWGLAIDLPDALLWQNAKDYILESDTQRREFYSGKEFPLVSETIYVYRENDLQICLNDARDAYNSVYYFQQIIKQPNWSISVKERTSRLKTLLDLPLLKKLS